MRACANVAIDVAVMERTLRWLVCLPLEAGWSDVGSWKACVWETAIGCPRQVSWRGRVISEAAQLLPAQRVYVSGPRTSMIWLVIENRWTPCSLPPRTGSQVSYILRQLGSRRCL